MRNLTLMLALATLTACAVGPHYRAPVDAPVALTQAATPAFSTASPVAAWWRQFDDPVLDCLVPQALAASPDLRIALSRVNEARAVFSERRLDRLPHVPVGAEATRSIQPVPGISETRVESETFSLGFYATWELDLFGRQHRTVQAASADLDAEREAFADAQVSLAADVARNYFELRGVQRRLVVARETIQSLRKTQQLTEQLWEYGAGTELETQSSLARVKAVEANVPELETQQTTLAHRLAALLGERPGALGDLLAHAPTATTARVGIATADLFPRISLRGFIGFLSGDAGDLLRSGSKAWSVTPSVSWAAFDMGSVRARLRATEAQADGVAANYEKVVLGALEDTENALVAYANRQAQWRIVLEQTAAARRAAGRHPLSRRYVGFPDPARCAAYAACGVRRVGPGRGGRERGRGCGLQGARWMGRYNAENRWYCIGRWLCIGGPERPAAPLARFLFTRLPSVVSGEPHFPFALNLAKGALVCHEAPFARFRANGVWPIEACEPQVDALRPRRDSSSNAMCFETLSCRKMKRASVS